MVTVELTRCQCMNACDRGSDVQATGSCATVVVAPLVVITTDNAGKATGCTNPS
jgi:hypothetical protein